MEVLAELPYDAQHLSKQHLEPYRALFASYLDIQKGIDIDEIDKVEVIGRWKSFVRKWNRGELAEGWYDPQTLENAISNSYAMLDGRRFSPVYSDHDRSQSPTSSALPKEVVNDSSLSTRTRQQGEDFPPSVEADNDDDEDVYGPTLPSAEGTAIAPARHAGPSNPTLQDIRMKHEEERYEREAAYEARQRTLAAERKAHKLEAKQLQEDIVPRAEPGTRERRLEKKREAAALNRAFAESRRGGSPGAEIGDEVLMGGGARSDLVWLKKERERMERKKNERELRREEILKARMAERAERLKNYRQREEQTISMFRTLAQQRFGTSGE